MDQPTRHAALRAIQIVEDLHDEISKFLTECGQEHSADSQAAAELGTCQRSESIATAYSMGIILIEAAGDQLMAFTKTITEPAQTIAPWTCVRAVLETSALAAWLLDPALDVDTRVKRSFAHRYEGLSQQLKFAKAAGNEAGARATAARIEEVEREALSAGFSEVRNRKGKRNGIAQRMPSLTDIIAETLDGEPAYRLLSAMVHAHYWATGRLAFRRIEGLAASMRLGATEDTTVHILEKNLSAEHVVFLSVTGADAFCKPIRYRCRLFGWDPEPVTAMLDSVFNSLGAKRADF